MINDIFGVTKKISAVGKYDHPILSSSD